jgi:hypothetical protein
LAGRPSKKGPAVQERLHFHTADPDDVPVNFSFNGHFVANMINDLGLIFIFERGWALTPQKIKKR